MHTIATYCHKPIKNASGKVASELGKHIKNYQVSLVVSRFLLNFWGTLLRTSDSIGWFGSCYFFVEQLKPIKYGHFRGTQNAISSLNLEILSQRVQLNKGSTDEKVLVGTEGLEPPTSSTSKTRSSQLSYVPNSISVILS